MLFADDKVFIYKILTNPLETELINDPARLQVMRSIYKHQLYFLHLQWIILNEIKKILFTIASKRIKYFGTSLTKEVQNVHSENYKILLKERKPK